MKETTPTKETLAYKEIIAQIKTQQITTQSALNLLKRDIAKKHKLKTIPTNIQLLLSLPQKEIINHKHILLSKPTRTVSGVTPVAIMTKPGRCPHGKCTFCPGGIGSPWGDVPQSYTGHEPATMRGIRNDYDSYLQVFNRLQQYVLLGHSFDKVELIVMGGTFPAAEKLYQEEFILGAFQAMNDFSSKFFSDKKKFDYLKFKEFYELPGDLYDKERENRIKKKVLEMKNKERSEKKIQNIQTIKSDLEKIQQENETAEVRCVALCIETKPDWGFLEHGTVMLRQGCTRVELGIESVYDDVLTSTHRGHTTADSKKSIQILRDLGFKINFHYMPGLPHTDRKRDLAGMKQLFTDPEYKPDMIKMYPCMVAPGTALFYQWKTGKFTPITTQEAASRITEWKKTVPEYCRIQRVQRDVPTKYWEAGVDRTNLRQFMHENFKIECRCIRCREPKGKKVCWEKVKIKVTRYEASGGKEFFISAEESVPENILEKKSSSGVLVGFCRMRFPKEILRKEITSDSALIRELHVYGTATAIGEEGLVQHRGWGKKLMQKAEDIAQEHDKKKMVVISGVGVREYYRKLGYEKEGMYMVKNFL